MGESLRIDSAFWRVGMPARDRKLWETGISQHEAASAVATLVRDMHLCRWRSQAVASTLLLGWLPGAPAS